MANSVDPDQLLGVFGCGDGVVYLLSPGRPTDTSLQLAILVAGKGRGECFISSVSVVNWFKWKEFIYIKFHIPCENTWL